MWEKKHKVVESGGWGRNLKHNAKPKMRAKALKELTKRGVKLVWK